MVRVLPGHDWRVRGRHSRIRAPFGAARQALLRRLPLKPRRNEAEQAAADALLSDARASRESFLAAHVEPVYDRLTERGSTFRRLDELVYAAAKLVPGLVPTQKEVARRSRSSAGRQGRRRDRSGPIPRPRAFAPAHRRASLPRDVAAAAGKRRACRRIRLARLARSRRGASHAKRQGRPSRHDQSALPQRRGRHDPRRDRARRRRRDARSDDRDRRHARRRGRQREISGQAHFWRGHQSHPSLSRQDSLPLVPDPRPRLRAQAPARRRRAGERPRRRERPWRRKAMDRRGRHVRHRRPLPGACCAWTMFSPRRTPS